MTRRNAVGTCWNEVSESERQLEVRYKKPALTHLIEIIDQRSDGRSRLVPCAPPCSVARQNGWRYAVIAWQLMSLTVASALPAHAADAPCRVNTVAGNVLHKCAVFRPVVVRVGK